MFAQRGEVMDIKKLKAEFEKLKYIEEKLEYLNFDEHLGCYVEKNNGMPVGLAAWVNGAFYGFEQAAKAQAVPEGFVLVEKKEFEQMQEFEDLYRRAIFNSKKSIHEVNWSHVSNLGVGSTRAKAMCKRFNIDPEATFRKPQEPTND